MEEILRVTQR